MPSADDTAPMTPDDLSGDRIDRAAGTAVGRYILVRRIGRGGMGMIYEAFDPELGRLIALKLVAGADAAHNVQLAREARALAAISHPNVVTVHDVGTTDEGATFIAMELVAGQTLTSWRGDNPNARERRRVLVDAARGLLAAHAADLVHRDVKPDNVMVSNEGRVVVLDFGLVAASQANRRTDALGLRVSSDDALRIGTPSYMAPEQFDVGVTDAKADQFAFCLVAWEVLFDERPFGTGPADEIQARRRAGEIANPRRSGIDRRLQRVLMRGLAAEPGARWPSLAPIIAELERKPLLRPATVAAAAAMVAVGGSFYAATAPHAHCRAPTENVDATWNEGSRERVRARVERAEVVVRRADDYALRLATAWSAACDASGAGTVEWFETLDGCLSGRTRGLEDIVETALGEAAPPTEAILDALTRLPDPQRCLGSPANRPPPPAPEQRDEVAALQARLEHAERRWTMGRYEEANAELDALEPEIEARGYLPLLAHLRVRRAVIAWDTHQPGSVEALESAYAIAVAARDQAHAVLAATLLAQQYAHFDRAYEAGMVWAKVARAQLAGADLGAFAELHLADVEAGILLRRGEVEASLAAYRTAVARGERELRPDETLLATLHANLATAYMATSQYAEARPHFETARAELEEHFGRDGLSVGHHLTNEAMNLRALGDIDDAITLLERSLDIFEQRLGHDHPLSVLPRTELAWALLTMGDVESAQQVGEGTDALALERFGRDNTTTAAVQFRLGWIRARAGALEQAQASADDCDAAVVAAEGSESAQRWLAAMLRGHIARMQGRSGDAVAELERALRWVEIHPHAEAQEIAAVEFELGTALIESRTDPARGDELVGRATAVLASSKDWGFLLEPAVAS